MAIRAGIRQRSDAQVGEALSPIMPSEPSANLQSQEVQVNLPRQTPESRAYPAAPELRPTEMGQVLGEDTGMLRSGALGALSTLTFDQEEMLSMLQSADPTIVGERGPEGEIYVYKPGGNRYVLNRPGMSFNDLIQIGTSMVGGTPASFVAKQPIKRVLVDAAIEAGLQTAQTAAGGEFNVGDILTTGGASAASEVIPTMRTSGSRRQALEETEKAASPTARRVVEASTYPEEMAQREFARIVDPDPSVVRAAEELGLQDVLPARVYSRNEEYIRFEQAMSRANEAGLAKTDADALNAINRKTDDFLTLFGGQRDIAGLSETIRTDIRSTIGDSHNVSDRLYDQLAEIVPERALIETTEIRRYLLNRARDLGGIKKLSKYEQDLLAEISRSRPGSRRMTYGRIDDIRQSVGQDLAAAYRGQPLGDAKTHQLSGLYDMLTGAQGDAIRQVGGTNALDMWNIAKSTVAQRKALEERSQVLLGKELSEDAVPKIVSQMRLQLPKGDTSKFLKFLDAVPEQYRQETIISAIGQMFETGARRPGINMGGYADWWEKVSRQKGVMQALNLDTGAIKFLDNLSEVSRRYSNAASSAPATGVVRAILNVAGNNGFMNKLLGVPMVGKPFKMLIGETADPKLLDSTNALLENAGFKRFLEDGASGKPTDVIEEKLLKTPVVKQWLSQVPPATATRILSVGLTRYFFGGNSEGNE